MHKLHLAALFKKKNKLQFIEGYFYSKKTCSAGFIYELGVEPSRTFDSLLIFSVCVLEASVLQCNELLQTLMPVQCPSQSLNMDGRILNCFINLFFC